MVPHRPPPRDHQAHKQAQKENDHHGQAKDGPEVCAREKGDEAGQVGRRDPEARQVEQEHPHQEQACLHVQVEVAEHRRLEVAKPQGNPAVGVQVGHPVAEQPRWVVLPDHVLRGNRVLPTSSGSVRGRATTLALYRFTWVLRRYFSSRPTEAGSRAPEGCSGMSVFRMVLSASYELAERANYRVLIPLYQPLQQAIAVDPVRARQN